MFEYPAGFKPELRNKPICGVIASAICAGVDYDVAHAAAKRTIASGRKRFGGRMRFDHVWRTLTELGATYELMVLKSGHAPMTLGHFAAYEAKPGVTYLVHVTGHFITLRDGYVIDQAYNGEVRYSRSNRRQVKGWVEIVATQPLALAA